MNGNSSQYPDFSLHQKSFQWATNVGGLTLLEFIVSIGLSVTFVWLSIPELKETLAQFQLQLQANEVASFLEEAKALASSERETVQVLYSNKQFTLRKELDMNVRRTITLPSDLSLVAPAQPLSFYSSQVNSPARVLLQQGEAFCEVIISLRGRIRTECS
ncbi:MAG: hypothetical protein KDD70_00625 [Bdellovibrionales bacterium]|nr:hypothetical protein [Bdellovibrionales bacterium]